MSTIFERIVLGTVMVLVLIVATGAVHAAQAAEPGSVMPQTAIDSTRDGSPG